MSKINLDVEELEKIKTICDYLFFDEFKEYASYQQFEQSFSFLTSTIKISLEKVFKEICGEKRKYITFKRFIKKYLQYKNNPSKTSEDVQNFFVHIFQNVLLDPEEETGEFLDNTKKYSSGQYKNSECLTKLLVLCDGEDTIQGLKLQYDDMALAKLYDKEKQQGLIVKIEMHLPILNENQLDQETIENINFSNEELYRDSVANIFGTYTDKVEFLGFKCRSGKVVFVGSPIGEPFLYGAYGQQFNYIQIDVSNGIKRLVPYFKPSVRGNIYLKKNLKEITKKFLDEDELINDEVTLQNITDKNEIDKFIMVSICDDKNYYNQNYALLPEEITGDDVKDVISFEPRNYQLDGDKSVDKKDMLNVNELLADSKNSEDGSLKLKGGKKNKPLTHVDLGKRKPNKSYNMFVKEDNINHLKSAKRGHKPRKLVEPFQPPGRKTIKPTRGIEKWDGDSKVSPISIIRNSENFQLLSRKISDLIKSEIEEDTGVEINDSNKAFYENYLNKIKEEEEENQEKKEEVTIQIVEDKKEIPKIMTTKSVGKDGLRQSLTRTQVKSNKKKDEELIDDFINDMYGGDKKKEKNEKASSKIPKPKNDKKPLLKNNTEKEKYAQSLWRQFTVDMQKNQGLKILQTMGAVIKAMHILSQEDSKDLPGNELLKLYKLLEDNSKIVQFLNQPKEIDVCICNEAIDYGDKENNSIIGNKKVTIDELNTKIASIENVFDKVNDINKQDKLNDLYLAYKKGMNVLIAEEDINLKNQVLKHRNIDISKINKKEEEVRNKSIQILNDSIKEKEDNPILKNKRKTLRSGKTISTETVHPTAKIYRRQQIYKGSAPWTDKLFPPTPNSLCTLTPEGDWLLSEEMEPEDFEGWENIDFCRAEDIFRTPDYNVFSEGITESDIIQGSLGNCYFLSAIAALTKYPNLIEKLFFTKEKTKEHLYGVYYRVNGVWKLVLLDDYVPSIARKTFLRNNKPHRRFAFSSSNGNELWVILLEKAWAKLNGNYAKVGTGGVANEVFDVITDAYSKVIDLTPSKKNEVWPELMKGMKNDYIMTAGSSGNAYELDIEEKGLVPGHAYTLKGVYQLRNGTKLVKLRNPYGNTEWNGDWSERSNKWTNQVKRELGDEYTSTPGANNDGVFFMSYDDFSKYFVILGICELHDDYISNFRKISKKQSKIGPVVSKINIKKKNTHVYLQLYIKNPRLILKDGTYPKLEVGFIILLDSQFNYVDSNILTKMSTCIEATLNPGIYYIISDVNYRYVNRNKVYGYSLTTYSNNSVPIEEENKLDPKELIRNGMTDFCIKKLTPSKSCGNSLLVYNTSSFKDKQPFNLTLFRNNSKKKLDVEFSIKVQGSKSFCLYADEKFKEDQTNINKSANPGNDALYIILPYSRSSIFKISYCAEFSAFKAPEENKKDDRRNNRDSNTNKKNAPPIKDDEEEEEEEEDEIYEVVFSEEPSEIDDNVYQYLLEDNDEYYLGIENKRKGKIKVNILLQGMEFLDTALRRKKSIDFQMKGKTRTYYKLGIKKYYKGESNFTVEVF